VTSNAVSIAKYLISIEKLHFDIARQYLPSSRCGLHTLLLTSLGRLFNVNCVEVSEGWLHWAVDV